MIIHISIRSVIDAVMAASAMAATCSESENPPLLTTDHNAMLDRCARAALRAVSFELAPFLDDVVLEGEPSDLELAPDFESVLRLPLEGAIEDIAAHRVLHLFYSTTWPPLAAAHLDMAKDAMERLQESMMRRPGVNFRIAPGV